jgi:hypothetical protein
MEWNKYPWVHTDVNNLINKGEDGGDLPYDEFFLIKEGEMRETGLGKWVLDNPIIILQARITDKS